MAAIVLLLVLTASIITGSEFPNQSDPKSDVGGLSGQEILLPCSVDVNACGDFHSIKWYRGAQRIFVFSELANLERSEGFLANRARFVLSSNASSSGLKISSARLSDQGVYRCEITYLVINEPGCPTNQYVNLTVLAAPEYVEILLEDGRTSAAIRNVSRIGPFNEGSIVTVLCRSGGGRPVPRIDWWNGQRVLPGDFTSTGEESGAVTGINRLQVALSRQDLAARWQCRVSSPTLSSPLIAHLQVDVHVPPANVTITGLDGPVTEGTAVVLYCVASGGRPAASIAWYNGSSPLQKSAVETTQLQEDGTFVTRSRLIFTLSRFDHQRYISCQASNTVTEDRQDEPIKTSQFLQVHFPPTVLVSPENITVNESMDVLIFCTYDANPITLTAVQWFKDDEELIISRDKYEGATLDQPALLLKKATREDSGAYTCRISNAVGTGESENVAFVSVQYPPTVRLSMEPQLPVNELERPNVTLTCDVADGNPTALLGVRWFLDGELLKELPDCPPNDSFVLGGYDEDLCDVDPSKLLLEYVGRSFQGNYSCEAMNAAGWGPRSDEEDLIIYYPPGNTTLTYDPEVVVKDGPLLLTCNAADAGQPAATQYRWTRNGHVIPEISDAVWNVSQVTLNYQANYSCTPVNEAGEGDTVAIEVEVLAPPQFIERLPAVSGAPHNAPEVKLSCRIECYPLCDVEWFRNGQSLQDSHLYVTTSSVIPENPKINQHQSILSTLSFNLKARNHGRLDPIIDMANFTCASTENSVGGIVSSTTLFRVEYAPENATVDRPMIEVEEGSVAGHLQCQATAYPEANYYWQYNHQIIGNGPRLMLDYGLSRDKTGEYACIAHNQHGNSTARAYINVIYKPECSISVREVEGKTRIICEVNANPKLVDFTWMLNNTTLTADVVHMGLQSILTVDGAAHTTGVYFCYANNSAGASTPCEINIEGSGGLLAKFGDENIIIIIAVVAAAIVMILVVCIVLMVICRRKRAEEKYNPTGTLEERENSARFVINVYAQPGPQPSQAAVQVTSDPQQTPPTTPKSYVVHSSLSSIYRNHKATAGTSKSLDTASDGQSDNNKSFYENLPFHGLQNAPNKDDPSRPSSQMSHAASSGYGSARSNGGTAGASTETAAGGRASSRNRGSLMGSLRHLKPTDTSPFRSLRMPRADSSASGNPSSARDASAPSGNEADAQRTATLPALHSVAEKHEVPVPAPRFQTLKRHAYQNIPLPLKNADLNALAQNPPAPTSAVTTNPSGNPVPSQPPQPLPPSPPSALHWKPRPAAVQISSEYTRVYDTPAKPLAHYDSRTTHPAAATTASGAPGRLVYADLAMACPPPPLTHPNELSPTEYAVLQFMGAGQEVQPFKATLADLEYADVDYKAYGPTDYKRASVLAASEKKARQEAESQGLPARPPRETRL